MDWMATLSTTIASLRLILISLGMWMLLRSVGKMSQSSFQKRCFSIAGIIYLLGLLPQTLVLLLVNSDLLGFMVDNGYLCWIQKLACMTAVMLHNLIILKWITDRLSVFDDTITSRVKSVTKRKYFNVFLGFYVVVFVFSRCFFLKEDDSERYYTDLAYRVQAEASSPESNDSSSWTRAQVQSPSQVVRLQLLLCESTLCEKDVLSYLLVSYSFLIVPAVMLGFYIRDLLKEKESSVGAIVLPDAPEAEAKGLHWWEHEENLQCLLSAFICVWYHMIEPIIFTAYREHFVDFGTHLLLTICVFVPWTISEKADGDRNWV